LNTDLPFVKLGENNMENTNDRRIVSLDVIRIAAVLAVVMTHTSAGTGFVTVCERSSSAFMWGNFFDSISRAGVPLFVMVSGALMLDERINISLKGIIKNNIKNIIYLTLSWSVIYTIGYNIIFRFMRGEPVDFKTVLLEFALGHYHMWYMYMIAGLYLITPFLRSFVKIQNSGMVSAYIVIALMVQFTIPIIQGIETFWSPAGYIITFLDKLCMKFFAGYTAYYLMGWYIVHAGIQKIWKKYVVYAAGTAAVIITVLYVNFTGDYSNGYSNLNIMIFIYSLAIFTFVHNMDIRCGQNSMLIRLSNLTFGIYIMHPIALTICQKYIHYETMPLLHILLTFATAVIMTFSLCILISKMPLFRRLIRM
jgi:surface polysaccharide O-acyltransferase-like enzyme